MAIDWALITSTLQGWLEAATGWTIVTSPPTTPPDLPYGWLRVQQALTGLGRPEQDATDTPGEVAISQPLKLSVACDLFGDGAFDKLHQARMALHGPTMGAALQAAGLGLLATGAVLDQTVQVDGVWEPRARLEADFALADTHTDTPGWIDSVAWAGTYAGDGTPAVSDTDTATP